MSMLDRYRKGNAIMDLVKLVEDSAEPKRSQLLNMVRAEDAEFSAQVEARVLNWEKIRALPEGIFAEVIAATPAKFVAMILCNEEQSFVNMIEKCLGKAYNEYKQEKDNFKSSPPAPAQVESARRKMIAEARKLDNEGKIKIGQDGSPALVIVSPTGATSLNSSTSEGSQKQTPVSAIINGTQTISAKVDDPCPPLETFNLGDPPPPGLSGERLETYLKTVLGF